MRIAVYSGSFNPLHTGHLSVMRTLSESGAFDGVYLVVSPQNPLKDSSNVLSGRERLEAAVLALGRHPELKVRVEDIELTMEAPHYTIRTLDALRKREPSNSFTLVMGGDNLAIIRRWRDYARILLEYGVVVYPREGSDNASLREELLAENPDYRIELLEAPLVNISSTRIRDAKEKGEDLSGFLM